MNGRICCRLRNSYAVVRLLSQSTSHVATRNVKRRNTTERSFEVKNSPYISYPKSSVTSMPQDNVSKAFQAQLEASKSVIRAEIMEEVMKSSHQFKQPYYSSKSSQIAFLTKDELEKAQENALKRCSDILQGESVPRTIRPDISSVEDCDPGLAWLYESPVTFVDCNEEVYDGDRYMVTRDVDGTLAHEKPSERDAILGCFFKKPGQIFPPLKFLESDELFSEMLMSEETDKESILDVLPLCYDVDHPVFQKRYNQITHEILHDVGLIDKILFSRHFLPMVERALVDKHLDMSLLIHHLNDTGRTKIAEHIMTLVYYNDPRACQGNEKFVPGQLFLYNGGALKLSLDRRRAVKMNEDFLKASLICDVDILEIKNLRVVHLPEGKSFIVTFKDHKIAKQLHNNGKGSCRFYDSHKFECFPVKKEKGKEKTKK